MAKSKLISVRIDEDTLARIDRFSAKHIYWKRNAIICNMLATLFETFSEKDLYDMTRFDPLIYKNFIAKFKIEGDL